MSNTISILCCTSTTCTKLWCPGKMQTIVCVYFNFLNLLKNRRQRNLPHSLGNGLHFPSFSTTWGHSTRCWLFFCPNTITYSCTTVVLWNLCSSADTFVDFPQTHPMSLLQMHKYSDCPTSSTSLFWKNLQIKWRTTGSSWTAWNMNLSNHPLAFSFTYCFGNGGTWQNHHQCWPWHIWTHRKEFIHFLVVHRLCWPSSMSSHIAQGQLTLQKEKG